MKTYFKNLDALRFLAFLVVFVSHIVLFLGYEGKGTLFNKYKNIFLAQGDLGVSFFFVLSGFLITFFLFSEKDKNGFISFYNFYIKKFLRIFPVYFLVVLLGFFVIYPLVLKSGFYFPFSSIAPIKTLPWYLLFIVNFKMAFSSVNSLVLAVLWAVSVEVQFYIVWPILVSYLSLKNILRFILILISISFLYRFFYYDNYNIVKYSTFSVMSDLAIGALVAYVMMYTNKIKNSIEAMPKWQIASVYICGIFICLFRNFLPDISSGFTYRFLYTLLPVIVSVFFAFIILEQNLAKYSFVKFGRFKLFNYLGIRSYGLYCYHLVSLFIVLYVFGMFKTQSPHDSILLFAIETILVLLLTILLSVISYTYFEKKFLTLKNKFSHKS